MKIIANLFSDWVGLLSLFTIVFVIGMAIYLYFMLVKKMDEKSK